MWGRKRGDWENGVYEIISLLQGMMSDQFKDD